MFMQAHNITNCIYKIYIYFITITKNGSLVPSKKSLIFTILSWELLRYLISQIPLSISKLFWFHNFTCALIWIRLIDERIYNFAIVYFDNFNWKLHSFFRQRLRPKWEWIFIHPKWKLPTSLFILVYFMTVIPS